MGDYFDLIITLHYTHASVIDETSFRKALEFSGEVLIIAIFQECVLLELFVYQIESPEADKKL